jgi:hypothetical protein
MRQLKHLKGQIMIVWLNKKTNKVYITPENQSSGVEVDPGVVKSEMLKRGFRIVGNCGGSFTHVTPTLRIASKHEFMEFQRNNPKTAEYRLHVLENRLAALEKGGNQ